jgi:type I restriction enzyme S subunit
MELNLGSGPTETADIPEGWSAHTLGTVGNFLSGGTPSMSEGRYWNGEIPWVSPKDMKVTRLHDALDHVTEAAIGNGTRMVPPGSLLLVVRGMILAHSFPVARAERALAFNQDIKVLIACECVDSEFMLWWFQSNEALLLSICSDSTHGTKRLPSGDLFALKCVMPPLPEQRAIAAALSDVDALLAKLDVLIAKKRDLKQAAMQQLLTGKQRLPGYCGEWVVKHLGNIAQISMGRTPSRKVDAYWGRGYPWLSIADMRSKFVSVTKEEITGLAAAEMTVIPKGTLMMSFKLTIGKLAFAGCDIYSNEAICNFRDLKQDTDFLYYMLSQTDFSLYGKQAVKGYTLNTESLRAVEVGLPPFEEQRAIAAVLSDMDAEIAALEARLEKTRALKQGMMQELLTGRIRLL